MPVVSDGNTKDPGGSGGGGGLTSPVGVADGGTGATDATTARSNLGAAASTHTHIIGDVTGLQGALDGKAASSHTHSASAIVSGIVAPARVPGKVPVSSGSDGDVTISGSVTLTRDMYYNNLTLATGGVLNPAGYRIFVAGTLAQTGGKISGSGNPGTNSTGQSGGAAGAALAAGTLGPGGAGGAGVAGLVGNPATTGGASPGGSVDYLGGRGGSATDGGRGGDAATKTGGTPGALGTFQQGLLPEFLQTTLLSRSETAHNFARGGLGGGGGGGGAGNSVGSNGGGSGGGGGGARIILVFANIVDVSAASGVLIEAIGGAGGNGAVIWENCGGGGGGAGGGGGYIGLYCNSVIGSLSNAIDVSGGAGGAGGNGNGTGNGGRGGRGGDGGNADFYRADTGVWTSARSAGSASGTAATAPSGVTGTTGGAGEVVRLSI